MIVEELLATLGVQLDTESIAEAEGALGGLKAAGAALIAAFGFHELHEMVKSVAEVGDAANKSSQKLGLSVEAIQELGYAAKLSDISQESLEGSLRKLSRSLDEVYQTGSGPAADALKRLGINVKDLKGETVDANLEVIADAFARMPDGVEKSALAMKLFGRSGTEMIPFLNEGSAGIKELREEAQKLGIVIEGDVAKEFEEFNDDQTRLSEAWRGLKVQVVSDLLPALHGLVTGMLEWIKANRDAIASGLKGFIEGVVFALRTLGDVASGLKIIISDVVDFVKFLVDRWDIGLPIMIGLLILFRTQLIGVIESMVTWFLEMSPLSAFLVLVLALSLAAKYLADNWDKVVEVLSGVWERIKRGAQLFWEDLKKLNADLVQAFEKLGTALAAPFIYAYEQIVKAANAAKDAAKSFFGGDVGDALRDPQAVLAAHRAAASGQGVPVPGTGAQQASFGDTNVTVNTVGQVSEEQVAALAADAVKTAQKGMLTDAYDTMKGGKR